MASPLDMLDQPAGAAPQPQRRPRIEEDKAEDNLPQLIAWFEDAEEASEDARKLAERDRDYYDSKQFTPEEEQKLRKRGQPVIVVNRIQPKVNFLLGFEATNRTDPRAFPRTPQDEQAAHAATDALRYLKDKTDLEQLFSNVWENLLIEGVGGIELTVEQKDDGDTEIVPVRWDWDRVFWDPHSRRHDFSDARYLGGVLWMDAEEAKRRWPKAADAIETSLTESDLTRTYDDRPNRWVGKGSRSSQRKRVRIVQMYHKEGGAWKHCTFTKGAKLEAVDVPFVDQDGQSWCPLLLQSGFTDRDNNRYGLVRSMIGVQDEINKRRSKALHRITVRQFKSERGAVEDVDQARAEAAKPDGWIEYNPGFNLELLDSGEGFAAELQLLQEAKNEIELLGPNAAMLGKDDGAPSGRAIIANKQGGQTEISLLMDRHRHIKKRTFQGFWNLIRQYKKKQWWVRVTDNEENVKFVGFNRPVTMKDEMVKRLESSGAPPEAIQQQMMQLQQAEADPMMAQQLQTVVRTENVPGDMWMDITLEEVPDVASVQEEQFQQLTSLAPAVVFPPQVYIKASSLRNKKELLEELEKPSQPDPVEQQFAMKQAQQVIEKTAAEIEHLKAQTIETHAKALKAKVEADTADAQLGMITDPRVVQAGAQPDPAPAMAGPVPASPPPGEPPGAPMPPPGI